MRFVVEPMELEDIPQVLEVDRESYTLPWPASAYRREVLHNRNARYVVLRAIHDEESAVDGDEEYEGDRPRILPFLRWPHNRPSGRPPRPGRVVGYAGMWIMVNEAHITTIAVRETWRGRGLGELLLCSLVEEATSIGADRVTLEVRVTNDPAQALYRKYGFTLEGTRPRYYSDNNEDAYIMTTGSIQDPGYRAEFDALVDRLRARLVDRGGNWITAPVFPLEDSVETRGGLD